MALENKQRFSSTWKCTCMTTISNISSFLQWSSHWHPTTSLPNQDLLPVYCLLWLYNHWSKGLRHLPALQPLNSRLMSVLLAYNLSRTNMQSGLQMVSGMDSPGTYSCAKCLNWHHQDEEHTLSLQFLKQRKKNHQYKSHLDTSL